MSEPKYASSEETPKPLSAREFLAKDIPTSPIQKPVGETPLADLLQSEVDLLGNHLADLETHLAALAVVCLRLGGRDRPSKDNTDVSTFTGGTIGRLQQHVTSFDALNGDFAALLALLAAEE